MTELQDFRRHANGSIDYDHYIRKGRYQRSLAAHEMGRAAMRITRKGVIGVVAFVAVLPVIGLAF